MDEVFLKNVGGDSFSVTKKVVGLNFDILVTLFKIFICDDEHNASFRVNVVNVAKSETETAILCISI